MTDELIYRKAAIAVAQSESQSNNPYISGLAMRLGERIRAIPAADAGALGAVAMRDAIKSFLTSGNMLLRNCGMGDTADMLDGMAASTDTIPLPTHAAQLAAALALPEVAALVKAAVAAKIILAEYEPHPLPALGNILRALAALEARHD